MSHWDLGTCFVLYIMSILFLIHPSFSSTYSFRLFDEQKDVLILVFLEDIPTSQMSPYYRMRKMLKRKTYLSWPRAEEHPELFWEKLRQALKTKEDLGEDRFLLSMMD